MLERPTTGSVDQYSETPLLIAIHQSRLEVVEALLGVGANPNAGVTTVTVSRAYKRGRTRRSPGHRATP